MVDADLDVVIFGGGAAGLWLLDALRAEGRSVLLLEAGRLGSGQTVASQGILHGGLKYNLGGRPTRSAEAVRAMPGRWRESLEGRRPPDLTRTTVRSEHCWLWHTGSLRSRLGMVGARLGLQVRPVAVERAGRPAVLAGCRGVARLDEQVIDPVSLVADLAGRHADRLLRVDVDAGLSFELGGPATVQTVHLQDPGSGASAILRPQAVVLCAGAGNAGLRKAVGLEEAAQQRRPLRMVMVRGDLPELAGHCVDGARTRVTVTWARDGAGRVVWQLGGEVAETGVGRSPPEVLAHARAELAAVLPDLDQSGCEWASYIVDRAEAASGGRRPEDVSVLCEGNVITAWPTKLVLAPRLAEAVAARLAETPRVDKGREDAPLPDWPRPQVALPPWECETTWTADL